MTINGWFAVADALQPRDVVASRVGPQQLAVWADADGVPHVSDAFCPHLGAHLGHTGAVDVDRLQCGFHGWTFDTAGRCVGVPYAELVPDASIVMRPCVERAGVVFAWVGPAEPFEMPTFDWFDRDDAIVGPTLRFGSVTARVDDFIENAADTAHFATVHETAAPPVLDGYDVDGPVAHFGTVQAYNTPRGSVDGRLDLEVIAGGVNYTAYSGLFEGAALATYTPVDDTHCQFTIHFRFDPETPAALIDGFVRGSEAQVQRDVDIWAFRDHDAQIHLLAEDGPIGELRAWTQRWVTVAPA